MKNSMQTNFKIFLFLLIGLIGCKRDQSSFVDKPINQIIQATPPIPVDNDNGIMVFASSHVLDSVLGELEPLSDSAKSIWESTYGFLSMRQIFNDLCNAENALADSMENVGDSSDLIGPIKHSNLAIQYKSVLIERTIPANEGGGGYYEKNMLFDDLAWVTDCRGLVIIGDTLFFFSYDTMKYMLNASSSDANTLLSSTSTDTVIGIYVKQIGQFQFFRKTTHNPFHRECRNTNGRTRVHTYQDFLQFPLAASNSHTQTIYIITTKGFKRRLFGAWWDSKPMSLELSWEVTGNETHEGIYLFTAPPNPVFAPQNFSLDCGDTKTKSNTRQHQRYLPTGSEKYRSHFTHNVSSLGLAPEVFTSNVTGKACDGSQCAQCTTTK